MSLIIAHGVPKSGSTFLYQVIKQITENINGFSHYEGKDHFFPGMDVPDFVKDLSDDFVDGLLGHLPHGAAFVFKTHGKATPYIRSLVSSGHIKAVMSFRDPRDTTISMLDAGATDRAKGRDRSFSKLHVVDDVLGPTRYGWRVSRDWFDCPNTLLIPYYLISTHQDWVVEKLCRFLGATIYRYSIIKHFSHDKHTTITEYYKGLADRFLDDLSADDITLLTSKLALEISESDALTTKCMDTYGFRMLGAFLHHRRNARLAELQG